MYFAGSDTCPGSKYLTIEYNLANFPDAAFESSKFRDYDILREILFIAVHLKGKYGDQETRKGPQAWELVSLDVRRYGTIGSVVRAAYFRDMRQSI